MLCSMAEGFQSNWQASARRYCIETELVQGDSAQGHECRPAGATNTRTIAHKARHLVATLQGLHMEFFLRSSAHNARKTHRELILGGISAATILAVSRFHEKMIGKFSRCPRK